MSSQVKFVRSLKLAESATSPSKSAAARVVAGSLTSFTSEVSGQQLYDVQNSTLLAQLAATYKFPDPKQIEDWYSFYAKVLEEVGWIKQSFRFDEYNSNQASFKLSEVSLELLSALLGEDEQLFKVVKGTLDSFAKSQEGLTLFSNNSRSQKSGRFQILPTTVTNGQLTTAFLGVHFEASQVSNDYFFFSYKSQDIHLYKTTQVFTLDEQVYEKVRQAVIDKLGPNASDFVHNLSL